MPIVTYLGVLGIGSILTLIVKAEIDRRAERRKRWHGFYVDLYCELLRHAEFARSASLTETAEDYETDIATLRRLTALLELDASSSVRTSVKESLRLLRLLRASLVMRAPVEIDEHGFYHYDLKGMADASPEARALKMRMFLGGLADALDESLVQVAQTMRNAIK